jgi:Cu2+-exporting ATPase
MITEGEGQIDQHVLTGESQPAEKKSGDEVFAATLLLSGRVFIKVNTTGDATLAAKIGDVLNQTESYKDNLTTRGRKIADRFLPLTIGLSAITVPILGPSAALAVMWSELGGIMAPLGSVSVMNYLQILSRHNILVKDGRVFELIRDVDTVVFDKTGTLTLEQPTVGKIHTFGDFSEEAVLRYAAIAEHRQPHPVAKAILAKAAEAALDLPIPDEANYDLGYGISVSLAGETIQVGSARYLQQQQIVIADDAQDLQTAADAEGHSLIYVAVNQQLAGVLALEPTIRPEAQAVIADLKQRGITLYVISGDHAGPTKNLAESLGIDHYFADVLPERKADYVKCLKDEGKFVCFVGDGINDAIALKTAQVSVSLQGASSAATDTAQVVFMDGTLKKLPELLAIADDFEKTMQKNLAISVVPGIFSIAGVYLLHFSIAASMGIFYVGCFAGLGNILWPLVKYQETLALSDQSAETVPPTSLEKPD